MPTASQQITWLLDPDFPGRALNSAFVPLLVDYRQLELWVCFMSMLPSFDLIFKLVSG